MASVFRHLLDTMPLYAGVRKYDGKFVEKCLPTTKSPPKAKVKRGPWYEGKALDAFTNIQIVGRSAPWPMKVPAVPAVTGAKRTSDELIAWPTKAPAVPAVKPDDAEEHWGSRPLWCWQHDAATPNAITELTCRVRETGYKNYLVMESIKWGFNEDGKVKPFVRVTLEDSKTVDLPLDKSHMYARFLVDGGHLYGRDMELFPLFMSLDKGMVLAFAYDLGADGKVTPYAPAAGADKGHDALLEYASYCDGSDWSVYERETQGEGGLWIDRALQGSFMDVPTKPGLKEQADALAGTVGETRKVTAPPKRILVVISVAAAHEYPNYEPIGVVGMARFYPQIMVRASFPLKKIEASIQMKRPERSTTRDKGNGSVTGACCGSTGAIGALLVADNNEDWVGPDLYYLPFWSGLFAYYADNPERRFAGETLRMVNHLAGNRNAGRLGIRDMKWRPDPDWIEPSAIPKVKRQGQFDNIHISPRLQLDASILTKNVAGPLAPLPCYVDISTSRMKLDTIAMAPFCSHDCFHMHWRWSATTDSEWCLGWGNDTANAKPYTVAGAPLVPPGHDVDMKLLSATEIIYSEQAFPPDAIPGVRKDPLIPALKWEIFCYAGAAYAQGISDWKTEVMNRFNMWSRDGVGTFKRKDPYKEWDLKHPPVFYWSMRYSTTSEEGVPQEYLYLTDKELDQARKA